MITVQWVQIADHGLHALVEHMRVDLRRRDVGVAEQILHDPQVGAVLQQMAGEGMAKDVRADPAAAMPAAPAAALRSRAKACRVMWPLALMAGNSQRERVPSSLSCRRRIAALAGSDRITIRSRPPLPLTASRAGPSLAAAETAERGRAISSDTRRPVA